jgi:hypothetical protein
MRQHGRRNKVQTLFIIKEKKKDKTSTTTAPGNIPNPDQTHNMLSTH